MKQSPNAVKLAVVALIAAFLGSVAAYAQTYSLSGNWSNAVNPNSPWAYRQGQTRLTPIGNWNGNGTQLIGCNQLAWAPSNNPGNYLPAIMRANACTGVDINILSNLDYNVLPGDVLVYTVDGTGGNPSAGVPNILFTVPIGEGGTYQISGSLWDANLYYHSTRPQDWLLLVNGVQKASGSLEGFTTRFEPQTLNVTTTLAAGDTVELQIVKDRSSQDGDYVGVNMTIKATSSTPPPPPPPPCVLKDTPTYNATTGLLTMQFSVATPAAAVWRGWLVDQNSLQALWSQSLPITTTAVAKTKTHTEAKSGQVGVLSTLTTTSGGITCSSFVTINTGKP